MTPIAILAATFGVAIPFVALFAVNMAVKKRRASQRRDQIEPAPANPLAYDHVMTWEGLVVMNGVEEQGTLSFYEGRDLYPPKEGQHIWYKGRWGRVVSVQSGPRKDYFGKTYIGVQKLVLTELENSTPTSS